VFERFSELARQVLVWAEDEARALSDTYVGNEHILLGLLHAEEAWRRGCWNLSTSAWRRVGRAGGSLS
jgi:hypothetical protein